jgi:hypothetical protein
LTYSVGVIAVATSSTPRTFVNACPQNSANFERVIRSPTIKGQPRDKIVGCVRVLREETKRNEANDSLISLQCGRPTYIQGEGVCWGDTSSPTDTSWEASLPIQLITCFISQHSPLINLSSVYCNPKTPPKKPCGKN